MAGIWRNGVALTMAIACAIFVLDGCGSSDNSNSSTVSSPATTTTAVATLTKAQAADKYLEIVAPVNDALGRLNTATHSDEPTLAEIQTAAKTTGEAVQVALTQLTETKWPVEVQSSAAAVATSYGSAINPLRSASTASTTDEALGFINQLSVDRGSVQVLRSQLGLPPST